MKVYKATLALDNGLLLDVTVQRKSQAGDARRFVYLTTIFGCDFLLVGSHKPDLKTFKGFRRSLPANPLKLTYSK